MELITAEVVGKNPTETLNKDLRRRVGRKLKALRVERNVDQTDVVKDAKAQGLKLGTLQAIENAWYDVRVDNIDKYCRFFGTTLDKLVGSVTKTTTVTRTVTVDTALLADLNDEHLGVARAYMKARRRVRDAVDTLFGEPDDELSRWVLDITKNRAEWRGVFHYTHQHADWPQLMKFLVRFSMTSGEFQVLITKAIDSELQNRQPATRTPPVSVAKP